MRLHTGSLSNRCVRSSNLRLRAQALLVCASVLALSSPGKANSEVWRIEIIRDIPAQDRPVASPRRITMVEANSAELVKRTLAKLELRSRDRGCKRRHFSDRNGVIDIVETCAEKGATKRRVRITGTHSAAGLSLLVTETRRGDKRPIRQERLSAIPVHGTNNPVSNAPARSGAFLVGPSETIPLERNGGVRFSAVYDSRCPVDLDCARVGHVAFDVMLKFEDGVERMRHLYWPRGFRFEDRPWLCEGGQRVEVSGITPERRSRQRTPDDQYRIAVRLGAC